MKQISVVIVSIVAIAIGALYFANDQPALAQQNVPASGNVFAGKAIIITPTVGVAGKPKQDVRIEMLADRKFLVYSVNDDGDESFDYWMAADQVSRIRVFPNMDAATAYYDSRREKGVFH